MKVTFTTNTGNANADHIIITFDLETTSLVPNFVAILNHNMVSADAMFRIAFDDTLTHLKTEDQAGSTRIVPTEVLDADGIADGSNDVASNAHRIITPAADGHTIVKFTGVGARYYGIQIEGSNSNSFDGTDNLKIGCILLGQYFDMPHSPDMTLKRSITFDGVDV